LVLDYTDDEANSIINEVGDALEQDRQMKQAMAELTMQDQQAQIDATNNPVTPQLSGGAGNGNGNGVASGARGTAPVKKSPKAALKNQ
jgi:hypothetical protein